MSAQIPLSDQLCFQALMEHTADSIYFKDRQCRLMVVSRKMASDLKFANSADLYGKTDVELFGEESGRRMMKDDTKIMETGKPVFGLVESRRLLDGRINWTLTNKLPVFDGNGEVIGLMGVMHEIGEQEQNEKNLKHLATHDFLTDLPNRFLMYDRLEQVLHRAKRSRSPFAILQIDLRGFKIVNESYGPDLGDVLLRQIGSRLKKCVRTTDSVARLGGDKFAIILATLQKSDDIPVVANKILGCFARPFSTRGGKVQLEASLGISLYPDHGKDVESLLRAADYATYLSKRRSGGFVICPIDRSEYTGTNTELDGDA